uniref:Uncharacterized protein n=2 Tax=Staphylococcus aureus TaxID=1280 RepID=A0A0C6ELH9_STAAU|nr:hypothetical protein [Staphylococcus aureus]
MSLKIVTFYYFLISIGSPNSFSIICEISFPNGPLITSVRLATEVSIPNTAPMANILPPEVKAISHPNAILPICLKGFLLNMTVNPIILGAFVSPIIIK